MSTTRNLESFKPNIPRLGMDNVITNITKSLTLRRQRVISVSYEFMSESANGKLLASKAMRSGFES